MLTRMLWNWLRDVMFDFVQAALTHARLSLRLWGNGGAQVATNLDALAVQAAQQEEELLEMQCSPHLPAVTDKLGVYKAKVALLQVRCRLGIWHCRCRNTCAKKPLTCKAVHQVLPHVWRGACSSSASLDRKHP